MPKAKGLKRPWLAHSQSMHRAGLGLKMSLPRMALPGICLKAAAVLASDGFIRTIGQQRSTRSRYALPAEHPPSSRGIAGPWIVACRLEPRLSPLCRRWRGNWEHTAGAMRRDRRAVVFDVTAFAPLPAWCPCRPHPPWNGVGKSRCRRP